MKQKNTPKNKLKITTITLLTGNAFSSIIGIFLYIGLRTGFILFDETGVIAYVATIIITILSTILISSMLYLLDHYERILGYRITVTGLKIRNKKIRGTQMKFKKIKVKPSSYLTSILITLAATIGIHNLLSLLDEYRGPGISPLIISMTLSACVISYLLILERRYDDTQHVIEQSKISTDDCHRIHWKIYLKGEK